LHPYALLGYVFFILGLLESDSEMNPFCSIQKSKGYLIIGTIGLFFSVGYLVLSFQYPMGQLEQPGAGLFPVIVAVIMMLASIATLQEGLRMDKTLHVDCPSGANRNRLLGVIGLLLVYVLILPYAGQIIVSTLFSIFLLRILSKLTWPRILTYSVVISTVLYAIFVILLKVPLPRGTIFF
jgi:putative tricarboxylic transport membrane protein